MRGARSRNAAGSRVVHRSAGNCPRSMWSSQEISSFATIPSFSIESIAALDLRPSRGVERCGKRASLRSNRRFPFAWDRIGFVGARPGRHRHADGFERFAAATAELEMRAGRNRNRNTLGNLGDLLLLSEPAPKPAASRGEVPDLLDCAM